MSDVYGLICVGNSGVGKTFLINIILGKHRFRHDFSARSVTHRTESTMCILGDQHFRVYDIPGLIEGHQERIALNKREIDRAFVEQLGNPLVVIYVFGHQNGRIRNEDISTFRANRNAYELCSDSLITIVNGLPSDRPSTYNEDTRRALVDLLGMEPDQICFIDRLSSACTQDESVRKQLVDALLSVRPRIHTKVNASNLVEENVLSLKANLAVILTQVNNQRDEYKNKLEHIERIYAAAKRVSDLRRLFCDAKANLRRLMAFDEQHEQLISVIEQWKAEQIAYENDYNADHYTLAVTIKQNAQEQLTKNITKQHYTKSSLDVCRRDIEQICFELEQIYDGQFDQDHESVREYYILLDDLYFDPSINNVKHSFVNDLYSFTCLRYRSAEYKCLDAISKN